jgi:hypothetical protein
MTDAIAMDYDSSNAPPRVQSALAFLRYCHASTFQHEVAIPARSLSPSEVAVREAALRVLGAYFNCEMDFGDVPPVNTARTDDDGDAAPAPQLV